MSAGYCPLSLEFVSVCIVYKNNIKLGLREKVTSVNDGGPMELSEEVVDEFMENVPMSVRLAKFRTKSSKRGPKNNNNLGKGRSGGRPKPKSFYEVEKEFDNLIEDEAETSVADSDSY